jgi:hypothetical protein
MDQTNAPNDKKFAKHPDTEKQIASAVMIMKALSSLKLYRGHLEFFLSRTLWKITEAEGGGRSGKYKLRFRSQASLGADKKQLHHERVYQRRRMIRELIASPEQLERIVSKAVACVVTKDEHRQLDRVANNLYGWERYIKAGIIVIDMATAKPADLEQLIREAGA